MTMIFRVGVGVLRIGGLVCYLYPNQLTAPKAQGKDEAQPLM